ncbi:F5/8_type C domain-containing protein [Hexamita inflata]|uniref:F5/8 type C domain-containing protein n=1 Tax=Hexamita inflata TaxID=28002 RepID=A0AA86V3R8_9EUKA|nr:F5/8 type C domain-containing protein [Hexamita inflata]
MAELVSEVNSTLNIFKLSEDLDYVTRSVSNCRRGYDVENSYLEKPILNLPFNTRIQQCWVFPGNAYSIKGQYIEFDFHKILLVGKIITMGQNQAWVTNYRVEYFKDGE